MNKNLLIEWDKQHVWHPFTQMQNWLDQEIVIIDRAEGVYLIDTDGNRYIDGISSMWTNVHGHNHPAINRALKDQIDQIAHSTLLGFANVPSIRLAKKLVEITPKGLNRVFFSDNGSTAVEISLKMAFQYWQHRGEKDRKIFVHFDNSYHGDTIGSVSISGIDLFHKTFRPLLFETILIRDQDLNSLENVLRSHRGEIAGVVIEPIVQGAGGMIIARNGFLKGVSDLTRQFGMLMITDEVMTGFGRTGKMWACEHENVIPDFLCTAKGLSAGYLPIAATLTTDAIHDEFLGDRSEMKTFFHGHTFTGNQLGCAVALANIDLFEKENLLEKIQPIIQHLDQRLSQFRKIDLVSDVRSIGMIGAIDLVKDDDFLQLGTRVCKEALKHGVILRPLVNTIVIMPPLSISIEQLDQLLDVVERSIKLTIQSTKTNGALKWKHETL